jgi:hypothetical protein
MSSLLKGVALVAAVASVASIAPAQSRNVTVTIHRVRQIDDLDKPTPGITKDRADFYCQIWINGKMFTSKVMSEDDGRPYWTFSAPASGTANIRIKICEDDGGLERDDDFVDVNRRYKKKDLNFRVTAGGRISGDVSGRRGQMIRSRGRGDSSQGEVWFTVK